MMQARRCDVLVAGGGPAGFTVARQLAQWGYAVTVISRSDAPRPALAESLPPSCGKLFDRFGIGEVIDAARFLRSSGNTAWWNGSGPRSESFADGAAGYQVERTVFDRILHGLALDAGVSILPGVVRDIDLGDEPRVGYDHQGTRLTVEPTLVLDCSGRSGVVARKGLRSHDDGYRTLALVGMWSRPGGWNLPDPTHTLVESYGDGWGWSVPVADARRYVTVMVDPTVTDLAGQDLSTLYRTEVRKTRHLQRLVESATPLGAPWACDASVYTAEKFGGDGFLLVGDAASFIDPLASYGVKKAMASAWIAAVVAHTSIVNPAMRSAAITFYDTHERRVYDAYRDLASGFYRQVAAERSHPFWDGRAGAVDALSAGEEFDVESLREDPGVLAAFAWLKESPSIELAQSSGTRRVREPAIRGREVVFEDRLVGPGSATPIRFLRGVDLIRIVDIASSHRQVPDLFETYNRESRPVILPDFLGALSVLIATGILEHRTGPGGKDGPVRSV